MMGEDLEGRAGAVLPSATKTEAKDQEQSGRKKANMPRKSTLTGEGREGENFNP